MTNIVFTKKNNQFIGIECSGHTGYSAYGTDVLCASISSIVQTGALGLIKSVKVNIVLKRNDDLGYIEYHLPKNLSLEKLMLSQVIFETMYFGLKDLESGYSKNLQLEVIDL